MKKALLLVLFVMTMLAFASTVLAGPSNLKSATPWMAIDDVAPGQVASGMMGAAYPNSESEWSKAGYGILLRGMVVTGVRASGSTYEHCWNWGTDNASKAFDGDNSTFFDPFENSQQSWCGIIMDKPYRLAEIRICPREGWEDRTYGAAVQGSNDNGATWTTILYIDPKNFTADDGVPLNMAGWSTYVPHWRISYLQSMFDISWSLGVRPWTICWQDEGAYTMFRYVSLTSEHGDVGEIELYGLPADNSITITNTYSNEKTGGIQGTVIGAGGFWSDGVHEYAEAWDGRGDTFYDPREPGMSCWTGIATQRAYVLTEVRVLPRQEFYDRTNGSMIQGSNDGYNWKTLASFTAADCLKEGVAQTYITKKVTDTNAYSMFRYINNGTSHGDVSDIILIGKPGKTAKTTVVPGQVIGSVLSTDIRAYINGAEIPAYNIDGKLAVLVSDLNNYGFKTSFDNNLRKTTVTRNKSASKFTSVPSKASGLPIGSKVMSVFSTDIVVELDGVQVQAFNVDNRMAIYFSDLGKYGTVAYDNTTRSSTLTLK